MPVLRKVLFVLITAGAFGFIYANCESHEEELAECVALDEAGGDVVCRLGDYIAIVDDLFEDECLNVE